MLLDIYNLIDRIRPRPAMYLGENSVSLLRAFLGGYMTAAYESQTSFVEENPPFGAFHDWVAMKLGYFESTSGWANMLLAAENGDETKALERFFVYLDDFKQRQAKVILWAIPESGKSWRYNIVDGKKVEFPLPALVQIVKYEEGEAVFIKYLDKDGELSDREEYCKDLDVAFSWTKSLVDKNDWNQIEK
jgi:hypothetical protein